MAKKIFKIIIKKLFFSISPISPFFLNFFLLLFFATDSYLPAQAGAARIAVIKGKDIAPYNAALSGFKEAIDGEVYEIDITDGEKGEILVADKIKSKMPDLILSIGSEASYIATQNIKNIPIVFSMVSNLVRYGFENDNVTGVILDIPLRMQFGLHKEILPNTKKVGIIYSEGNTEKFIDEARFMAGKFNLEIISIRIKEIKELPEAVEKISTLADSLYLLYDPLITSSKSVIQGVIILRTFQKGIPVVGFNKWSVATGALYCLYSEYEDIGRQAGEMAKRILRGEKPSSIPVEPPRDIKVLFNKKVFERVASKNKVNIPQNSYFLGER